MILHLSPVLSYNIVRFLGSARLRGYMQVSIERQRVLGIQIALYPCATSLVQPSTPTQMCRF